MAKNSYRKPKPTVVEREIKTYNPTKSRVGKIIIVILTLGMFLGLVISCIYAIISYFAS